MKKEITPRRLHFSFVPVLFPSFYRCLKNSFLPLFFVLSSRVKRRLYRSLSFLISISLILTTEAFHLSLNLLGPFSPPGGEVEKRFSLAATAEAKESKESRGTTSTSTPNGSPFATGGTYPIEKIPLILNQLGLSAGPQSPQKLLHTMEKHLGQEERTLWQAILSKIPFSFEIPQANYTHLENGDLQIQFSTPEHPIYLHFFKRPPFWAQLSFFAEGTRFNIPIRPEDLDQGIAPLMRTLVSIGQFIQAQKSLRLEGLKAQHRGKHPTASPWHPVLLSYSDLKVLNRKERLYYFRHIRGILGALEALNGKLGLNHKMLGQRVTPGLPGGWIWSLSLPLAWGRNSQARGKSSPQAGAPCVAAGYLTTYKDGSCGGGEPQNPGNSGWEECRANGTTGVYCNPSFYPKKDSGCVPYTPTAAGKRSIDLYATNNVCNSLDDFDLFNVETTKTKVNFEDQKQKLLDAMRGAHDFCENTQQFIRNTYGNEVERNQKTCEAFQKHYEAIEKLVCEDLERANEGETRPTGPLESPSEGDSGSSATTSFEKGVPEEKEGRGSPLFLVGISKAEAGTIASAVPGSVAETAPTTGSTTGAAPTAGRPSRRFKNLQCNEKPPDPQPDKPSCPSIAVPPGGSGGTVAPPARPPSSVPARPVGEGATTGAGGGGTTTQTVTTCTCPPQTQTLEAGEDTGYTDRESSSLGGGSRRTRGGGRGKGGEQGGGFLSFLGTIGSAIWGAVKWVIAPVIAAGAIFFIGKKFMDKSKSTSYPVLPSTSVNPPVPPPGLSSGSSSSSIVAPVPVSRPAPSL